MVPQRTTVHSRFNRLIAIALWALVSVMAFGALAGDVRTLWVFPTAALAAHLAWAGLWRPCVSVGAEGVDIRNVSHVVRIPWEALIHVDTKYALTLHTPGQRFTAWSAPAPGMLTASAAARRGARREARTAGDMPRTGDLAGTDSGDAAIIVREAWRSRIESGAVRIGEAGQTPVRRVWDIPVITTSVLLAAVTVLTLAVSG